MRGEQCRNFCNVCYLVGSPPHARGKGIYQWKKERELRITPACAGKSTYQYRKSFHHEDHPRMRGEKLAKEAIQAVIQGSPPHARGKA